MNWIESFRTETATVIEEPFLRCLAEAIAMVESGGGRHAIRAAGGLNEIGYKAIPGHPRLEQATREADGNGALKPTTAAFRLFRDRTEQASALLWLLRSSSYYEVARLLFVLAFYSAYAPGRTEGLKELLSVYNEIARTGVHPGVRPFALLAPGRLDGETKSLNHAAARQAVQLFGELTNAG